MEEGIPLRSEVSTHFLGEVAYMASPLGQHDTKARKQKSEPQFLDLNPNVLRGEA